MEIDYFDSNVADILHDLTMTILAYTGGLALLFMVMIGVYYIASNGDPARQERAKSAIVYLLTGLLIIMFSYAILGTIDRLATK
jgi:multisubunit Na+/H+ antiporter MnhB subunit